MMTPLLFNLSKKKILVVGGGIVAARRVCTLLENGAQVVCVSPEFSEGLVTIDHIQLTLLQDDYEIKQLKNIDLVVAATNSQAINQQIKADCGTLKIWCNRVDAPEDSDFIFPSVIRRGDLTLSVCTEGASPSLTKNIIAELSHQFDESYTERTQLLRILREKLRESHPSKEEKAQQLKELSFCSVETLREKVVKMGIPALENEPTRDELEKNK